MMKENINLDKENELLKRKIARMTVENGELKQEIKKLEALIMKDTEHE